MTPRATPLPPGERRAAIIQATRPLIAEFGPQITTKQIAAACGIAEGTIFRVFDDKIELLIAVINSLIDPSDLCDRIGEIHEPSLAAQTRAVFVELQSSYAEISRVFQTVFTIAPVEAGDRMRHGRGQWEQQKEWGHQLNDAVQGALRPYAAGFRRPLSQVASLLVGFATVSSHGLIADGNLSNPDDILDILLNGIEHKAPGHPDGDPLVDAPPTGTQRKADR